ncbi:S-type pyocin domain-containing protein [Pseudomonas frederiksbergensis]|uniref:S-type pyocin domain-containing protein n=1 Tax=Pseudomonas frederiksbergensis TaxID=104087 RepID=UPI003D070661
MQKPPTWELTEAVHTTAIAPLHIPITAGTSSVIPHSGMFGPHNFGPNHIVIANSNTIDATKKSLEQDYQTRTSQLPQSIEQELAATRLEGTTHPLPPAEAIIRELGVRNTLLIRKTADFHQKTALANQFYGGDPLNRSLMEFYQTATATGRQVMPGGSEMQAWEASYRAAYDARLLSQSIQMLNQQHVEVHKWLAAVQANDRERIAAEQQAQHAAAELARINEQAAVHAREQARLAALAEAQRVAVEQARVAAEAAAQQVAAEQARLAALAEAQRLAAEQARVEAEAAAQQFAAEQAQVAALAEAQRLAAEQARISAQATDEQARIESQAEIKRKAKKAREAKKAKRAEKAKAEKEAKEAQSLANLQAMVSMLQSLELSQVSRPFPISGSAASYGPVFTVAAGNIATSATTSAALRSALRTAVSAVIAGAGASAGAIVGGFAALAFPSNLGNGELYALSVPLSELAFDDSHDLYAIAAAQGEVELPVAIGSRNVGNRTEFFVAASSVPMVPSKVPVRLATLYSKGSFYKFYRSYSPDSAATGMTWTPIVKSGNASTLLPLIEPNITVYNGTNIEAVSERIDPFPEQDSKTFGGFITVFPADSGIPPLYVVFSSPYDGANASGKYSGRAFNPDRAGGPIIDLNWRTAMITRGGIDAVKLHIARLDQSDANDIMIDRLEKILGGYLEVTETDQRYYTHELRELERFRAMELADDFKPEGGSPEWNNAHTATLEDYRLGSSDALLYSEEALDAANRQIDRIYKDLLKGEFQ